MGGNPDNPELVALPGSAWTLKARWALKHHNVKYRTTVYTPVFGAWWLRFRSGKWSGRITTPVMFTPKDGVLFESLDIAQWADDHSSAAGASSLFPAAKLEDIRRWNDAADTALHYARSRVFATLKSSKKLRTARMAARMPSFFKALGPLGDVFNNWYLNQFSSKYEDVSSAASLEKTKAVLRDLQEAIKANGGYVLGSFTYADIAMAVAVQTIEPVGPPFTKLSDEARAALTHQELKAEFGELVAWRDQIFQKHFPS
ncbi:hypothetical protein COCSUDRAFT_53495 [Coccomyxa subellipsoidea C-169]|uniref:GST N-terminal domain-containing protein n=1 Tax=Coccomyxa subellipsoidea (strain C-169) TaxID=574566 RepID=I0YXE0_COCSC|nr:hypothetical protein COCSUDRAFT_53495 [Coccomyxa subellipsoidea C-169]EIE23059.1 hypothetical protein COCSUDRAFT_53495 [Coccomyxa subellipsoidea C-169]|eukprot:XP_005647603.1 hypothetical protein COCSUDRAFT_53495 [Coccomyxa subellipsoidea C-169]